MARSKDLNSALERFNKRRSEAPKTYTETYDPSHIVDLANSYIRKQNAKTQFMIGQAAAEAVKRRNSAKMGSFNVNAPQKKDLSKVDLSKINQLPKATISNPSANSIAIEQPQNETLSSHDKVKLYDILRPIHQKETEERRLRDEEFAAKHPYIGATESVALNFLGSALTPIGVAAQKLNNPNGQIDENVPIFASTRDAQSLRTGAKEGIKQDLGIENYKENGDRTFSSQAVDFGVDTGLSMVDTVVRSMFANPLGGAVQSGLAAGSQAFLDAKDNGADDKHAVAQGIAQGVAEEFFEKFSLEGLKAFKTAPTDSIKTMAKNIAKQSFVEGSEEFATDWANAITDYMIMGGDSQWQQDYNALIQNGADEKAAIKGATANVLTNSLVSFLGGAISGGVLGTGAQVYNYKLNRGSGRILSEFNQNFTADELTENSDFISDKAEDYQDAEALEQAASTKKYLADLADKARSGKELSEAEQGAAFNEILKTASGQKNTQNNPYDENKNFINEGFIDDINEGFIDDLETAASEEEQIRQDNTPTISDENKTVAQAAIDHIQTKSQNSENKTENSEIKKESENISQTSEETKPEQSVSSRKELETQLNTKTRAYDADKGITYQISRTKDGYSGYITKSDGYVEDARHIYNSDNFKTLKEAADNLLDTAQKNGLISASEKPAETSPKLSETPSIPQAENSRAEAEKRAETRFPRSESKAAKQTYIDNYNGQNIVDYDEAMTAAYTAGKNGKPLTTLMNDNNFMKSYIGNDQPFNTIWKNGYEEYEAANRAKANQDTVANTSNDTATFVKGDSVNYKGRQYTVEGIVGKKQNYVRLTDDKTGSQRTVSISELTKEGENNNGRSVERVSDGRGVSESDEVRTEPDRRNGGVRSGEDQSNEERGNSVSVREEKGRDDAQSVGIADRPRNAGGRSGRDSEGNQVSDNGQRLGRGGVTEESAVKQAANEAVETKAKKEEKPKIEKTAETTEKAVKETEKAVKKAEKAGKETAKKQAKQKSDIASQDKPKGNNYVISPDGNDIPTTEGSRYKANVDAIKTLQNIISENRTATSDEQKILAKFTGWGGISNAKLESSEEELRSILSDDEYESAKRSSLDAYYTDPKLIRGIYSGLQSIGFDGGRVLEPSAGVGRFIGAMPSDLSPKVKSVTAVELDKITGNIAKNLYPQADVRVQGFEKAKLANGYMDLVVGNVPFGNLGVSDTRYSNTVTSKIHNYFIARSLDTLREGGVACLITSSGTLDSSTSNKVRQQFAQKADLIGAIRLPNNAFGDTGTNVVADILVFKKRAENTPYSGENFIGTTTTYKYGTINEYFSNHPEMILGNPTLTPGRYGQNRITYNPKEGTDLETQVREAFKNITQKMEYPKVDNREVQKQSNKEARNKKIGTAYKKDGKLFINDNGLEQELSVTAKEEAIYSNMVDIRDTAKSLINAMSLGNDKDITALRKRLNEQYDSFKDVYKNGFHDTRVKNVIKNDTDYAFMLALERVKDKQVIKSDIFTKNTVNPAVTITSVDTLAEGVDVSLSEAGRIDTDRIAELMHTTKKDVEIKLAKSDIAYKDANGNFVSADEYLSGNVRAKYYEAEMLAESDKSYQRNVDALKKVLPEWVKGSDVRVNAGVTWIPTEYYGQFMDELLELPKGTFRVNYNPSIGYQIEKIGYASIYGPNNTKVWGTNDVPFYNGGIKNPGLFANILNSKDLVVKYKDKDGNTVIDQAGTEALRALKNKIDQEFNEWLWKDADRTKLLEKVYNDSFNCLVRPKYSENVSIAGQSAEITLRAHQGRAVNRIVRSPYNTLLQHGVGAGKTFAAISSVMKLRQLGLAKKPVIVVPKNKIGDWRDDFYKIFPVAKVLVADDTTFAASNRKEFINKIATTDIDAVIISKEQFQKIPMSEDAQQTFTQKELDSLEAAISEYSAVNGTRSLTVRQLQSKLEKAKKRIEDLKAKTKHDDDNISFEETGIDYVIVDEAQSYKNLAPTTQRSNIAGMGSSETSQIANDMLMKSDYLRGIQNGKGLVFCTATPIMNTPVEAYTMLRFLANEELEKRGIRNLDNFIDMFGRIEARTQQDAAGRDWIVRNAFTGFDNMQEWQQLWGMTTDVVKTEDVPGIVLPKMRGGDRIVVVCKAAAKSKEVIAGLGERLKRKAKEGIDHIFKIQNDGKKASITQKYFDNSLPYGENEKIPMAANKIFDEWKNSKNFTDRDGNKQENGTQLVFLEWGAPDNVKEGDPALYHDLKDMLIAKGIPENEVAFIHDAKTDKAKDELYEKVRAGDVRVLIGSSKKMGEGLNIQDRIVAIHELMPLPRPGDIEQVEGRAIRQGNLNSEVAVYTYVTEGTFDTKQWNDLYNKSKFINEITSGNFKGRGVDMEFTDDENGFSASAADIMAISSGNPLLKEQVENADRVRKLENLETAHRRKVFSAREDANRAQKRVDTNKELLPQYEADAKNVKDISGDNFIGRINKKTLTKRKDFGEEVIAASKKAIASSNDGFVKVGNIGGFDLYVSGKVPKAELRGERSYEAEVNFNSPEGTVTRIANVLSSIKDKPSAVREAIKTDEANIPKLIEVSESKFEQASELEAARKRANEIEQQLLNGSGTTANTDTDVKIDPETGEILERKGGISRRTTEKTPIAERKRNLISYIKRVISGEPTKNFEIVDPALHGGLVDKISETVGFDVDGFEVRLARQEVNHINNRHGSNGEADHSFEDIDKLEFLVDLNQLNGTVKGENDLDSSYRNADNTPAKKISIETKLSDGTYKVIEVVPNNKDKAIYIKSAYTIKKEARSEEANVHTNPSLTSKTNLPHNASITDSVTLDRKNSNQKAINTGEDRTSEWTAEKTSNNKVEKPKRLDEIISGIEHDFGLNITTGHIRGDDTLGNFNTRDNGIKIKISNDLPTAAHELGHWFDNKYSITQNMPKEVQADFRKALGDLAENYPENLRDKEGMAEFMRKFLQNRETAAIDYPNATKHMLSALDPKELVRVTALADQVNAYYAMGADNAQGNIVDFENRINDLRTVKEKTIDKANEQYQKWVDDKHGIRLMGKSVGSDKSYIYATNAAYADSRANSILLNNLTDLDGNYVAPSLKAALHGISMDSKSKQFKDFNEYLVLRHGKEFLAQGKRVFADDRQNSTQYMDEHIARLESEHPEFSTAAARVYDFIDAFMQTYVVDSGILSEDAYFEMKKMYPCYVPFFRGGFKTKGNSLARAKGSGRAVINPIDNIITMITKNVNAATKNNVLLKIRDEALQDGVDARFIEKVPDIMVPKKFRMEGIKSELKAESIDAVYNSNADLSLADELMNIIDSNISDTIVQFEVGQARADVIQIMVGGKKEFWKVNDNLLLESIESFNPRHTNEVLQVYGKLTRFMTSNITGRNVIWSIFSNAPRDLQTMIIYAKETKRYDLIPKLIEGYVSTFKAAANKSVPEFYEEYIEMGGGSAGVWQGNEGFVPEIRKMLDENFSELSANPFKLVSLVSDAIEIGPRYAYFATLRKQGVDKQTAMYEAMDLTTNFRRHGTLSTDINKVVPFFNASVQGVDKMARFFTAEDIVGSPEKRKKTMANRFAMYTAASAIVAILQYLINNRDEEKKENYKLISNYQKNSSFLIPLNDGKYFAISKSRELGVYSSFIERMIEYTTGNEHAFDDFYSYYAENCAPSVLSEVIQFPFRVKDEGLQDALVDLTYGTISSLGIVGVGVSAIANRDFLGRPIESNYYKNLEPKKRYNDKTSELAYLIGQFANLSPMQIDYVGEQVFGGTWKNQKALFPINDGKGTVGKRDVTLGVKNTYVKDSLYSQDLVNWMYDEKDKTAMKKDDSADAMVENAQINTLASYYSTFNKLNKVNFTKTQRKTRKQVLETIEAFRYSKEHKLYASDELKTAVDFAKKTGDTSILPSAMKATIKDSDKNEYSLTDIQYVHFQNLYNAYYYEYMKYLNLKKDPELQVKAFEKLKKLAKEQAQADMLKEMGIRKGTKKLSNGDIKKQIRAAY